MDVLGFGSMFELDCRAPLLTRDTPKKERRKRRKNVKPKVQRAASPQTKKPGPPTTPPCRY